MLKRLLSFLLPAVLFAVPTVVFAATNMYPTGPKSVNVGQTFTVTVTLSGAKDVDTIRANGSYTNDLLQWKGAAPTGVFQNVSPGTYVDQAKGIFSFGAFTLSSHANNTASTAVLTFKALKAGTAYVQLTTNSRVLSAGEDQLGSVGRLTITVNDAKPVPEQPQPVPTTVTPGTPSISLFSASAPDPNVWYSTTTVAIGWTIQGKTVKTTYFGFDQSPEGPADVSISGTSTNLNVPHDGVWYAHLNVIFTDGTRQRADLRIQVDHEAPHAEVPTVDQTLVPSSIPNAVRFGTTDDTSGIDHYEVYLDGSLVASTTFQSYPLMNLAPGTHEVRVTAFDRAGNSSTGKTQFVIVSPAQVTPPTAPMSLLWLWIILILLFLLLIIIPWIVIDRRRKKKPTRR